MHENQETSAPPAEHVGRPKKAHSHKLGVHGVEESDSAVVPMKSPNKAPKGAAEVMEGRAGTEENAKRTCTDPTQSGAAVSQGLNRVRRVAHERRKERFTALFHHLTVDLLRDSFYALRRQAAPGVDGMRWKEYEHELEGRLVDLSGRVHRGTYRAQPSRRVYIPKADGRKRPLGIAALEDKIVQQAVVKILNQIYEEDFRGFSYGFRPGRDPHQALDALNVGIQRKCANWILDADIRGFFDHMSHEWTMKFLEHRIADKRLLRLITKWLTAGVSEDGEWSEVSIGTPQGAVISPLLANIYLHYVFDLWIDAWRKAHVDGDVLVVRYADDFVMGFQNRSDAEQFLELLRERLAKFGLELHPDKTRLIEFGRHARTAYKRRGNGRPETFTFLGFTHFCGQNSKGYFTVYRRTSAKRMTAKLQAVKRQLSLQMHDPIPDVGKWLKRVVTGYYRYHAVPGNLRRMRLFRNRLCRLWLKVLRRRSQRRKPTWEQLVPLFERWLPDARVLHPYPSVRFDARIQGRSRMR